MTLICRWVSNTIDKGCKKAVWLAPPIVITTNRAYKHWAQIFNNDSTLTSAILDRVMHHVDTVVIEGKSFRMKDEVEG